MATIISKNFYLTNTQMDDNSGLIGYQNLVTPSTITATSQLSSDPITSAANPATAWGWVGGDQPAPADAIEYAGTNYMPSPFDPSGWTGANDNDGTITNSYIDNPVGQEFLGIAERVVGGSGYFQMNEASEIQVATGDVVYIAMYCKNITDDLSIYFRFGDASGGYVAGSYVRVDNGEIVRGDALDVLMTKLSDGGSLIQVAYTATASQGMTAVISPKLSDGSASDAPVGSQLYVQAAYFGKADDWPATISTQGVVPDQTVTINTGGQQVDYIGIAKHNLNQIGLTVAIKYNGITVVPAQPVSEKQALLFLNNIASPDTVELVISGATSPPRIAVLYVGKALRLQRNIYVGHTPISYGRNRTAINGVSENGQYLGEIVVREVSNTSVNLQNLTPDWYRQNLDPFFALSPRVPCFWAWRPSKYENEVGYCWIEGDPQMSNQRSNGMVQCSWNFKGIV